MGKNLIKLAITSVREHLRIPLFANAYLLVANQAATAGLGLLYWTVAARLYPVEVVGENSAIISSIIFLAMLSELSLKSAMTRFVPRAGKQTLRLILTTLGIILGVGLVISTFLITLGKSFELTADLLTDIDFSPVWLILAAMIWTVFYVQDGIMTGMRQAKWVLVKNAVQSIAKIILLVVFFRYFADFGLVISWFLPAPIIVLAFSALILWRFLPEHQKMDLTQTRAITQRELFTSIGGDYLGGVLAETSTRLLPLLVIYFLGKEPTAYFNQAWVVATPFYLIATNMSSSFVVESSANMQQISLHSRRILRQMILLLVPAVALMWVGAPFLLHVFGKSYAQESFSLLRWLTLATLPFMFNAWFLSYARVMGHAKTIIIVQAAQLVLMLGVSYIWLPLYGITSVGVAWLLTHCLIGVVIFFKSIPILWPKNAEDAIELEMTPNQFLRRVDWRFLLTASQVDKSICFVTGSLAKSVSSISRLFFDSPTEITGGCDLAVAINPDLATSKTACNSIRQSGQFYSEWSTFGAGGFWNIRRRLKKAGFQWVKWYIPFPNPAQPRFWIPLESHRAASAYIAQWLVPGEHPIQRVTRRLLKATLGWILHFGLVPYVSTIAGRGGIPARDMFDLIRAEWENRHPEVPASQLSFLIRTGGVQLSSKIVCLVFAQPDSEQVDWVIKIPRFPEDVESLQHEKAMLLALEGHLNDESEKLKMPKFLFKLDMKGVELYGQTALHGQAITKIKSLETYRDICERVTEAQIVLAQFTRDETGKTTSRDIVNQMLDRLSLFANNVDNVPDLIQSRQALENLRGIPVVCVHNDFTPWNMVQTQAALGVFDWSDAQSKGLPLIDLVYGLATVAFVKENAHTAESMRNVYQKLLDPQTPEGKIFLDCTEHYAKRLGLNPNLIPALRLFTWMRHSFNELENRKLEKTDISRPFRSVCAPLWECELEQQSMRALSPLQPVFGSYSYE